MPAPPPPIRKQSKKTFFALRTPCPHLRFTGKAGKKDFAFVPGKLFCTSHPVPTLKVHRESREILFLRSFPNNFFALGAPCPRLRFTDIAGIFFFALRPSCPPLRFIGQAREKVFFALHAPCLRLGFIVKEFFWR
jgi:hypothetical protein